MTCHPALKCENQPSAQINQWVQTIPKYLRKYMPRSCIYVTIEDFSEHQMNLSILIAYRDISLLVINRNYFLFQSKPIKIGDAASLIKHFVKSFLE